MFALRLSNLVSFCALAAAVSLGTARAEVVVVGMNIVNPLRASVADQNEVLKELKSANVRVIRLGLIPNDKGMDFARRIAAQGIRM